MAATSSRAPASLRVLIVGAGGREHAYAWKLAESPLVDAVFVAPGNGGTEASVAANAKIRNVQIKGNDYPKLVEFARENGVGLVVPGPEAPLVDGIQGYFAAATARMEGSKAFSKDFMKRHNIPTAAYENFNDYAAAAAYVDSVDHPIVIKADGLAGGKGVIIPQSKDEAHAALKEIMCDHTFGHAGDKVVIEEFLVGDELSVLSFSDGYTVRSLPPAQDHKRVFDGDEGPNTGGMGCYAPTMIAPAHVREEIDRLIVQPSIDGMRREGFPFVGILFTGLMMTASGPKVLEYNVRGGDPETQTLLPLLSPTTDLAQIMLACVGHYLDGVELGVTDAFAATVIAVAGGYPGSYGKGAEINIDASLAGCMSGETKVFHAGTAMAADGKIVTAGGRVIAVTSTAATLEGAVKQAYEGIKGVRFEGMHYRKDIAHRAFRDSAQKAAAKTSASADAAADTDHLTYASAGVSIDAGNSLVQRIKACVAATKRPGTDAVIGGFGGAFSLAASGSGFDADSPTLIGAIDGVGTKLLVAHALGKHDTVGIDLVAMNVNDLVVQGAEPLFFLDCFSCSRLDVGVAADFVRGVADGCVQAGCALIGGETAEMPGLMAGTHYDAVGAAIGAIDTRARALLPRTDEMRAGDVLVGLASAGVHSNGFSLVRKIVEKSGLAYAAPCPFDDAAAAGASLGEALLTPTRIYVKPLLQLLAQLPGAVRGLAHITGGGLVENVPRMLPAHLSASIDAAAWRVPPVFRWLKRVGNVAAAEMARAFNNGIGMVAVVRREDVDRVREVLAQAGETVYVVGELVERGEDEGCVLQNLAAWDE
ncbi:hypothetical protein KEM52_000260 [Ascosphaera acerosa]|nr:hypothetical protein KEM52_000260 [Ascosphaera acerosa]